jgi:hypothetical protein
MVVVSVILALGLIRKSVGAWVQDFVGNIGFSNIVHAELLAVYYGLVMA